MAKRLRIAFVNDTFLQGRGADHVMFELARRLGEKHNVTVIATQADFPEENFKIKLLKGRKLVTGSWKDFLGIFELFKYRKLADQYDVINLHHSTLSSAYILKKNVIITCHGTPPSGGTEKGIRKFFRKLVNKTAHFLQRYNRKIVAVSDYTEKTLLSFYIPRKKIVVIKNGVDNMFYPAKKSNDDYMFYAGRIEKQKQVDKLIKISKKLEFPLKIAGTGFDENRVKALAKKIKAPVTFVGAVSHNEKIVKLFQNCIFFVSASERENYNLTFLEAAACGKASVAFKGGGIKETILNKKTGFLADNDEEFEKYCLHLIKKPKIRNFFGKNALEFAKKNNWGGRVKKYEKLFLMVSK